MELQEKRTALWQEEAALRNYTATLQNLIAGRVREDRLDGHPM